MPERHIGTDIVIGMVSDDEPVLSRNLAGKIETGMKEFFPQYSWKIVRANTHPTALESSDCDPWTTIPIDRFGVHHVTLPWHNLPAKTNGYRAIFEFARKNQANACLIVDPRQTGFGKNWIDALVRPGIHSRYDLVTPVYADPERQNVISSNLLAPMLRPLFGGGPRQPMPSELLLSAKLMDRLLRRHDWDSEPARYAPELWISFIAAAERFRLAESDTGQFERAPGAFRLSRQAAIAQITGALFALLEQYENRWPLAESAEDLDRFGTRETVDRRPMQHDGLAYLQSFAEALPALRQHWRIVLRSRTFEAVESYAAALQNGLGDQFMGDAVWVRIVYEFAASWRLRLFSRSQIIGLFTPLLLARAGSFLLKSQWMEQAEVNQEVDRLAKYFEALQPVLTRLWRGDSAEQRSAADTPDAEVVAA